MIEWYQSGTLVFMNTTATETKAKTSGWECMECGKKFRTIKAAEKATSVGCPKCGGCDIDLSVEAV